MDFYIPLDVLITKVFYYLMDNSTIFFFINSFDGAGLPIFKNKLSLDKDSNYVIWMCQFPFFGSPSGLG